LNTMEIPDMLILDEPLSNLDIKTSIHIMKVLKELEIPIILTLHHPNNIILDYVNRLIVLDAGEIILDKSLDGMTNKLEFYEENMLHKTVSTEIVSTNYNNNSNNQAISLLIENYKDYKADVKFVKKIRNSIVHLSTYFFKNKKTVLSILYCYALHSLTYGLLYGTDFSNKLNGYFYIINIIVYFLTIIQPINYVFVLQYDKMMPIIKDLSFYHIIDERIFTFVFGIILNIFVFINSIIAASVYSNLNRNNCQIISTIMGYFLINSTFEILIFLSVYYFLENISLLQPISSVIFLYTFFNNGTFSNNENSSLKKSSIQYYFLNLVSVKAQELFNYPLLPNGEYVYTTYGFKEDTTNYLPYTFLFWIPPILAILLYKKNNRRFLT